MAHIVSAFDEDLVQVQAKISEMGGLCEELLSRRSNPCRPATRPWRAR